MREYEIDATQAGRRLDKWLLKQLPALPMSMAQKYMRTKCVKRNRKPAKPDDRLEAGDTVQLYIPDEFFVQPKKEDPFLKNFRVRINVLYEDNNIMLLDKRPGIAVHADEREKVDTLLNHIRAYLYQKNEYDPFAPNAFSPALCNRIDRFTGGIVIAAKNEPALKAVDDMIRNRQIEKRYLLIAKGRMRPESGMLNNYILKPEGAKKVQVVNSQIAGAKDAKTRYATLAVHRDMSLLECELLTGRTHQIRAQFAHAGHPLLGDTQYGDNAFNSRFNRQGQALYAWRVVFHPGADTGAFAYLDGLQVSVPHVPFVEQYFPEYGKQPV